MRTVSFLGSDIGLIRFETALSHASRIYVHKLVPRCQQIHVRPKRNGDVLKRIILLNAGCFRLLGEFHEIPHDAQRLVANGVGLRSGFLGIRIVVV